ncbi:MAG: class I SAM-dependent methyltransferase [Clostridia bacterium]|nr:class I SAM-dependent methyltransferase [Clostridia bacterium]
MRLCSICGSEDYEILYKVTMALPIEHPLSQAAKEFEIVRCKQCGFCFANILAKQEDYDRYYSEYNNYTEMTSKKKESDQVIQDVLDIIQCNTNMSSRILDMGSGCGRLLLELRERNYLNLCGIDTTEDNLVVLRTAGISAEVGSVYDTVNTTERYDLVCLTTVLEHLLFPEIAVKNLKKYLAPKGKIVVTVPNVKKFTKLTVNVTHHFNFEHINYFSLISLDNLFKQAGMKRVSIKETNFVSDVEDLITVVYQNTDTLSELVIETDTQSSTFITRMLDCNEEKENKRKEIIKDILENNDKVILWGIGAKCYELLSKYPGVRRSVVALVDASKNKQGQNVKMNDDVVLNILSPENFSEVRIDGIILICVSAIQYKEDILGTIKTLGIENQICVL